MQQIVSKSQFKAKALEYFRKVEEDKEPITITHEGKPVLEIIPYKREGIIDTLRGTLKFYKDPKQPVGMKDWEALK